MPLIQHSGVGGKKITTASLSYNSENLSQIKKKKDEGGLWTERLEAQNWSYCI